MTKIMLEIKSMGKSEEKSNVGVDQVTFNCVMKGSDGIVKATLKLESADSKSLDALILQRIGMNADLELKPWNKAESE